MFNKKYSVWFNCDNCETQSLCKIPKGNTIVGWVKKKGAKCNYCGCTIKSSENFEIDKRVDDEDDDE